MHHPTDRIAHTTAFVKPVVEEWLEREIAEREREREREHIKNAQGARCSYLVERQLMVRWMSDPSLMVDPLNYFSFIRLM